MPTIGSKSAAVLPGEEYVDAMAAPVVFFLIGYPGVGKHSIASAMVDHDHNTFPRLVLVDNHYINNPIFGLLDVDGLKPVPSDAWRHVHTIRDAVFDTIRDLSPRDWSFVITNYLSDEHLSRFTDPRRATRLKWRDPEGLQRVIKDLRQLQPEHPNLKDLEITDLQPEQAAEVILNWGTELSSTQ
jgi:hypothetical protein